MKKQPSCYIIGNEKLVISCSEILLSKKFAILGIITSSSAIQVWAMHHHIPCHSRFESESNLTLKQCDYLFSIVNYQVLPEWVIALAKQFAINYHDSLLPKYAGVHATSWALLNKEKTHGITWHIMTSKIDAGDILKQAKVEIDQNETTLSLNLKCHDLAIQTFSELIDELTQKTYQRVQQDLAQRTYYSAFLKPPANGFIKWNQSASEINCFCRALDFGHTTNRLASTKFMMSGNSFIVGPCTVSDKLSTDHPGTVVDISPLQLQIATETCDIIFDKIYSVDGNLYTIQELCDKYRLSIGIKLETLDSVAEQKIKQECEQYAVYESFWVKQLSHFKSVQWPFLPIVTLDQLSSTYTQITEYALPIHSYKRLVNALNDVSVPDILLILSFIYLYRLGNTENLGIGYGLTKSNDNLQFTNYVPITLNFTDGMDFATCLKKMKRVIKAFSSKRTYLRDVYYRYPELKNNLKFFPISIVLMEDVENYEFDTSTSIVIVINVLRKAIQLFANNNVINSSLLASLKAVPNHLQTMLNAINKQPKLAIAKLQLLSNNERKQILYEWNETEKEFPDDKTVHQLFEQQAEKTPHNIAVSFEEQSISYVHLNQKANQVAHYLQKLGVNSETIVAICFDRGLEMIIAILGVLKAGGVYMSIDPNYPVERIEYMFKDSGTKFLLGQQISINTLKMITNSIPNIISFDQIWAKIQPKMTSNLISQARPKNLIYIIYTSGSTGKPKGVLINHEGVVNTIDAEIKKLNITDNDRVLSVSAYTFDAFAWEMFGILLAGGTFFILNQKDLIEEKKLIQFINRNRITIATLTPSFLRSVTLTHCESLRLLVLAGETLPKDVFDTFITSKISLVNAYGPTEASICTSLTIHDKRGIPACIGKPIQNTRVYVLDKYYQSVPIGVVGELYIEGVGLARGYLNCPEEMKQHFLDALMIDRRKVRVYKTGDLVRWLPDGNLEYMGRIDDQIKIRGYRVELGEIENNILHHPAIAQTVVLPLNQNNNKQLIAFIVRRSNMLNFSKEELKGYLATKLPGFMVPSVWIEIDQIPLTPSGKLDRIRLQTIHSQRRKIRGKKESESKHSSTISKLESELVSIWEEVLNTAPISLNDNFFSLGGDSISAMQVVTKARQCGIHFSTKHIFLYPTIKTLATISQLFPPITEINAVNAEAAIPLIPIQHWFFEQNFSFLNQWSQACLLDITGKPIDIQILRHCFQQLIIYHDTLRIRFYQENNIWHQHYTDDNSFLFKVIDLPTTYSKTDKLIEDEQIKLQESFDLTHGPLFGIALITVNNLPNKLLLVIHHLIIDGVSWRILLNDLLVLYDQLSTDKKPKLPYKTSSYKTWSLALSYYAQFSLLEKEKEYWLQPKSVIPLPTDFRAKSNDEGKAVACEIELTVHETQRLVREHKGHSTHINEILLSALAKMFEEWTNQSSILIDVENHGRTELENNLDVSRTIGWFTSLYPLYLTWPSHTSIDVVLKNVSEQMRNVPYDGIGYGVLLYLNQNTEIVKAHQKARAQISFNYWGQFKTSLNNTFQFNWLRFISHKKNNRAYLLDINCWVIDNKFHVSFTYSRSHFRHETIMSLLKCYIQLLKEIIGLSSQNINNSNIITFTQPVRSQETIIRKYPLTSMQKGMLFHTLHSPQSEAYCIQLHWQHNGDLNELLFHQSWQKLVNKYDILRTSFKLDGLDEPVQVVYSEAELICQKYNWCHFSKEEFANRLSEFLHADRQAGFDLMRPPLMRLTIIRTAINSYYLVVSLHHIIVDGWCTPILLRELSQIYQKLSVGENVKLIQAPSSYRYIQYIQERNSAEAIEFWRHYLSGFHTPTDLVITERGSHQENHRIIYRTNNILLTNELTMRIERFAKKYALTTNTIFQGLWSILLARYSQTEDIVFGISLSTRSTELIHSDEMIGLFINTVPLRIQLNDDTTVLSLLNSIQTNFRELREYRFTPLTNIESSSDIPSSMNLFQSVMVFENYPVNAPKQYLFDSNAVRVEDPSHYPLVFYVIPGCSINLRINYDNALISQMAIERLMGHLRTLLNEMVIYPDKAIFDLSLLESLEYQRLLVDSYTPFESIPFQELPHQIFERQAKENPHAIALIFQERKITYQQLNEEANQLAHYLRKHKVSIETMVAICVERSVEMIVGILGILKAGGAYLPIDPIYPDGRIELILSDSKTQLIILQQTLYRRLKHIIPKWIKVILIDTDWTEIALEKRTNPINVSTLDNLMYVIYTSGSTGQPKGVILEHRNVLHLFTAVNRYYPLNKDDVWTLFHSFAFDFSVWEIWGALLYGGSLIIVPYATTRAADDFYRLVLYHKVTILSQTPSAFHQFAIIDASLKKKLDLRLIIFDGEPLTPKIVHLWFKSHDYRKPKLINMYGITETTVHLTCCEITPNNLINGLRYPIGKGLPGVALYVLDKHLQPLPVGVPGELFVGGNFLGRGYLDLELTTNRFLPNPLDKKVSDRLYRTGDLVRRLENNDLDYLGRLDNQIKFRGFRIELQEIATWIEKYPGITHAIVIPNKIGQQFEYLVAYATTKHKKPISENELKNYLRKYLSDYMVPDHFVFIKKFQLNSNCKIDKQALPFPQLHRVQKKEYEPAHTLEEKILVDIWKNLLGIEQIGIHDNFFDLGGHSLLALQVLIQVKQRFSIELPVRAIFDASTISELATVITSSKLESSTTFHFKKPLMSCLVPLQPHGHKTPLFLVHPVGGTVFWYVPMIKYFDSMRPLYGIQDPGIENLEDIPFKTVGEMASFYIEAIRHIQPRGPYLLGGASGGATISFEMTRQLLQKGEQVHFLGLLDGWVPFPEQLRHEEFFEAAMRRQYNVMHEKFIAKGIDRAEKLLRLQWQRSQLLDNYRITCIKGKLTLFKAKELISIYQPYDSPFNHWEKFSTYPIKLYHVPGDHETMFQEPNIATLTQKILTCLQSVDSEELKHDSITALGSY